MRVVFLLVFLLAWPGGITSNPVPDVVAGKPEGSGLSTSQTSAGVVGPTLEGYQGSTGANENGKGQTEDGVVVGRSRRLSSSDGESGDVPMPKAVVDTKSFEVSSGNDAEVNILAGSKVVIKIHPEPFLSIEERASQSNKLKMDLICDGNGGGNSAEFGFYRDDKLFTSKISVGSSSFVLLPQIPASFDDFIFENGKVTSSKINAGAGESPIPFTAPKCLKNSDGQDVWRAKFSTADSRVKFKVEIENTVVSAESMGGKTGANSSTAGFFLKEFPEGMPVFGYLIIAGCLLVIGGIVGGVFLYRHCSKKGAKAEENSGTTGDDEEDSKDSQKSGKNQKSKKKKKGGKKGKKKGNKANANAAAAAAGGPNQANPNGAAATPGANAAAAPAAPGAAAAGTGGNAVAANGEAGKNAQPAKFGNKSAVSAAADNNYEPLIPYTGEKPPG